MSYSSLGSLLGPVATAALSIGIGVGASGLISSTVAPQTVYVEQPVVEVAASPEVTYLPGPTPDPQIIAILPVAEQSATRLGDALNAPAAPGESTTPTAPVAPPPAVVASDDDDGDDDGAYEDDEDESGEDD